MIVHDAPSDGIDAPIHRATDVITVSEKVLFGLFLGLLVVLLFVTGIVLVVT